LVEEEIRLSGIRVIRVSQEGGVFAVGITVICSHSGNGRIAFPYRSISVSGVERLLDGEVKRLLDIATLGAGGVPHIQA
jgi:hypothetical protein